MEKVPKLLFLHNTAKSYRIPFFKILNSIYNINFVFTSRDVSPNYTIDIGKLDGINYKDLHINSGGVLYKIIRSSGLISSSYDVIVDSFGYNEMIFSFLIAKLRRKPIIFWSEDWGWERKITLKRIVASPMLKFIASNSDAILVPGTIHKNYFLSLGAKPENVFIMVNASPISIKEVDYINEVRLREQLNLWDKQIILYVGRLVKRKGIEYLLKAFSKLRTEYENTALIVVGQGECKDELLLLSNELGLDNSVHFVGYVSDELLPAYYLLCNICVVPSVTYGIGDPWVFVVNEAMYFSKPVIATDAVGAAFDMIKDGVNGYIVREKDSDELYSAINTILSDPILEINMGKEAKRIVESQFNYENMVDAFSRVISHVLAEDDK